MKNYTGYVFAALAAASYGTNPVFAKPLYADGMNPDSVLLFRYAFGIALLGLLMICNGWRRHNLSTAFRVSRHSLPQLVILGILMALSSLTLFLSYNYMPVGIASTLLFTYPILVAVIMTLVYHEPMSWLVVICLLLATSGVGMLCEQTPPSPLLRGETPSGIAEILPLGRYSAPAVRGIEGVRRNEGVLPGLHMNRDMRLFPIMASQ